MLEAVIELPNTTVEHIMTPRTEMTAIEVKASLEEIKQTIQREGHSRIPVYEDSVDNILGMLYAKDLIRFVGDGHQFDLRNVLRDALMVPEAKSVRDLLADFKARKVHIAVVLDEFGGTAGLVTIEDVIEEIIGDIEDEYEPAQDKPSYRMIDEQTVEVDARVYVDDLNEELGLSLPEDEDYDTVGGFVFSKLGHIPEEGEQLTFEELVLVVVEAEKNRVKRVRLENLPPTAKSNPPAVTAQGK
jgi:CBS domain containing-hemolysin-like protein